MTDAVDLFEQRVSRYELVFTPGPRAGRAHMPDMVGIYMDLAGHLNAPPDPFAFTNRVVDQMEHDDPSAWPKDQVRRRALVTWTSLVRQQHFLLCLRVRYPNDIQAAYWFPWLDHHGIDILAVYEPFAFGVALSLDTDTARFWAESKERRHPPLKGIRVDRFEVNAERHRPLAMANGLTLWLHPDSDIEMVVGSMRAIRVQVVDSALLNVAEERALVESLKARGVLRSKYGYAADARPLLSEYRLAARAKSLGFSPSQPGLDLTDGAVEARAQQYGRIEGSHAS